MPSSRKRARDVGVKPGELSPGSLNAITDVPGVRVGHVTIIEGESIRTGVTAIIPAEGNLFQRKVPAAVFVGNGFGKLSGSTQVQELGNLETPIVLTNTLAVGTAINAVVEYMLGQSGNERVQSVNAVVGETNDGVLNDIRARRVRVEDVLNAIQGAKSGMVEEGNVGAGTGTICFGFKGGIGTSSRVVKQKDASRTSTSSVESRFALDGLERGWTVGVIVQTNFGGALQIDGAPVGRELKSDGAGSVDGSCMIVVATDAPLDARNLERLAKRAFLGLGKTGGIASNGSGDYVIAFSTADELRIPHRAESPMIQQNVLHNDFVSPLFQATIEATEEAILNSLFMAETMIGKGGKRVEALPLDRVIPILQTYNRIQP
ncbi:MAG TPA: P1 family peptidase [Tepidisphaeraceae bacterium]|nr:P1 family peptidase [Tepidisphaeraceae bacterium]